MRHRLFAPFLATVLLAAAPPSGQPRPATASGASPVTLEQIMAHPDWIGRQPQRPYWADDSAAVFYYRQRPSSGGLDSRQRDLYTTDLGGIAHRQIPVAERALVDSPNGVFDLERRRKAYVHEGDLFVKDLTTGAIRQLTRTSANERSPMLLTDGRVAFRRGDQVLVRDLETGLEEHIFELEAADEPAEERRRKLERADFLHDQQSRLFRWIREDQTRADQLREERLDDQREDPARPDLTWYLGADHEIGRISVSPSGTRALVTLQAKQKESGRRDEMPRYVTDSGYVETREVRAKVGTPAATGEKLILLDRTGRRQLEIDLAVLPGIADDPLADLRAAAADRRKHQQESDAEDSGGEGSSDAPSDSEADSDSEVESADPEDSGKTAGEDDQKPEPRELRFTDLRWSADGQRAAVQATSLDNKDRWIAAVDLDSGTLRPLHRLADPAWINWSFRDLGWLSDNRTLYFLSEESGYSQLYVVDADGDPPRRLSQGQSVVDSVTASPAGDWLYFTANPGHPGIYEVFRVSPAGGRTQQITDLGGRNEYVLSPDGDLLLLTHSTTTGPPELFVQDTRPGAKARRLTDTLSEEFLAISWIEPAIVEVPSSHGDRPIYSRLYLPPAGPPTSRPAVVFVHGAGYLQNSHQGWSGYFREFMFHTLLAEHGYVVLDMDYRASAGYGRDWRTAIYQQMGIPELEDLADGVAYLAREHGVDPARVGVYGGSYGGFLTLMALFTQPDLFAAGAALRPVTDWAHYNHRYTSNILNTPEIDPEAYARSSPIEFADGLAKPLLICTGMLDDNVFFQDSVRLVQRLIELEKENWEIAIFPVEPHGFREPSSWLNEYRRIFHLFETHLK